MKIELEFHKENDIPPLDEWVLAYGYEFVSQDVPTPYIARIHKSRFGYEWYTRDGDKLVHVDLWAMIPSVNDKLEMTL